MELLSPKLFTCLRSYSRKDFVADLLAGLTVGLVALPLAIAFAIASGVPPQAGLYCAVIAGFLISALGGSRHQIGGPTGAFVVVVADVLARHGWDGLLVCTILAGIFLVLLGVSGVGSAVKFIPRPVIVGFTNGIAVLIASTQLKDFFGLAVGKVPGEFVERMDVVARALPSLSIPATILSIAGLLSVVFLMRISRRIPAAMVVMVAGTAVVLAFGLPIDTVGSRFGELPRSFPRFALPHFDLKQLPALLPSAMTIALLGAIESLLSAVVGDRLGGGTHRPNAELAAQGVANIVSPLFGGLPATGAIARTATNIRSGARTPVAGIIHSLTLLSILLFAAPLAKYIPLPVLSAILLIVAWNMGEWREIPHILKLSLSDKAVWAVTFALTVFVDLTVAVGIGMVLAALLFIQRVAATTTITEVTREDVEQGRRHVLQDKVLPDYVSVFRIQGPFLFGTTDKIAQITRRISSLRPVVLIRLRNMYALDGTGLQALEELADKLRKSGRTLILCGAREQPSSLMASAGFQRHVGAENICLSIQDALVRASEAAAAHGVH